MTVRKDVGKSLSKIALFGPDFLIKIWGDSGQFLVKVDREGILTYGEDYNPSEAAQEFWERLADVELVQRLFPAYKRFPEMN